MRIVHVSDCYPPRLGGIETQVRALASRQGAAGHDVHVITATPASTGPTAGRSGTERLDGVTVHRVVAGLPFDLPVHPRVVPEVRALLGPGGLAAGADAVHVHGGVVSPFAYPAAQLAAGLGLPTVATIHGVWGPLMGPVAGLADRLAHWSAWRVLVTAVSEAAAGPIRAAAPGLAVRILPNGIDAAAWAVPHQPAAAGTVRLLAVMRLAPRKRGVPLLRAFARAAARVGRERRLELTVVGEGPARPLLAGYADRLGVADRVRFTGRVGPAQVREELARADAFVAPGRRESFGIAALEARTAGVPVIALEGTGVTSFVQDGVAGLLAADDNQLVDAVVRITLDDQLRARIAGHNREVAPEQDWSNVLPLVESYYRLATG
ncbi:MAG TPA: glycosyltransferase family 4 protein [Candidatus Nanopelagicales bacterium]|nr:glycosyltransferase family 4 protein [Candidatus Nanopelagicales bacterium]